MKDSTLLLAGGAALLAFMVLPKGENGMPTIQLGDTLVTGDTNVPSEGGMFDFTFLGGIIDGLQGQINGITDFLNNWSLTSPDQNGILDGGGGLNNGGQGGTGFWDYNPTVPSGSTIIDISNAGSQLLNQAAKATVVIGGAAIAAKVLPPVLSAITPPIASALGSGLSAVTSGVGNVGSALVGTVPALTAPVSLSVGTVGAVAATGVASYAATTYVLNRTGLTEKLEHVGEAAAGTSAGKWIKRNILGQEPAKSQINTSMTVGTNNMTLGRIRELLNQGYTPSQISAMANK